MKKCSSFLFPFIICFFLSGTYCLGLSYNEPFLPPPAFPNPHFIVKISYLLRFHRNFALIHHSPPSPGWAVLSQRCWENCSNYSSKLHWDSHSLSSFFLQYMRPVLPLYPSSLLPLQSCSINPASSIASTSPFHVPTLSLQTLLVFLKNRLWASSWGYQHFYSQTWCSPLSFHSSLYFIVSQYNLAFSP